MAREIKLPELAEGVDKGTVINVLVKEGDVLEADAPIVELESEKATVTVPSPLACTVLKVNVKTGETVKVGQTLLTVEPAEGATESEPATKQAEPSPGTKAAAEAAPVAPPPVKPPPAPVAPVAEAPAAAEMSAPGQGESDFVPAGPAVRRIARELGIDLRRVPGSGRNGRIVVEDLDPFIRQYVAERGGAGAVMAQAVELPDFSLWGTVSREPFSQLRKRIAEKMSQSWTTVPHVHQFHEADITELLALRARYAPRIKEKGGALTVTTFALKAVAMALKEFPRVNSSYDPGTRELILKQYYHIGIAVDTEGGLVVPVLRDVDRKQVVELAVEMADLAQRARDRKLAVDDMRGGTFTISNLGGVGGTHFTPIVNVPEVAILGIGRSSKKPVITEHGIEPRDILPVVLGYDHRVIDGAEGARFLNRVVQILEHFEATFLGF